MDCLICGTEISEYKYGFKTIVVPCEHIICDTCLHKGNKCPVCGVYVFTGQIKYIEGMKNSLFEINDSLNRTEKQLIEHNFNFVLEKIDIKDIMDDDEILIVQHNTIMLGKIVGNILQNCIAIQRDSGGYYRSYPSDRLFSTEWVYFYKVV